MEEWYNTCIETSKPEQANRKDSLGVFGRVSHGKKEKNVGFFLAMARNKLATLDKKP
jgi:hypothetical protein